MSEQPKPCAPVPCPSFNDAEMSVARCPTCGDASLKWYPDQPWACVDAFHNSGLTPYQYDAAVRRLTRTCANLTTLLTEARRVIDVALETTSSTDGYTWFDEAHEFIMWRYDPYMIRYLTLTEERSEEHYHSGRAQSGAGDPRPAGRDA